MRGEIISIFAFVFFSNQFNALGKVGKERRLLIKTVDWIQTQGDAC